MFNIRQFAALAPDSYQQLHYHEQLESTNDEAHRLANEGVEHGSIVLADYQTQGRGRRGARWMSGPGDGLLFSMVLRPEFDQSYYGRIALAAGLAIAAVLREEFHIQAELKWPNDVLVSGKKCCGVLVESKDGYVVLGVGINVCNTPDKNHFVAVNDVVSKQVSREKLLAHLLPSIMKHVDHCATEFDSQLRQIEGMSYLHGKQICFLSGDVQYQGSVQGIASDGSLIVTVDGELTHFAQASDVRVVGD